MCWINEIIKLPKNLVTLPLFKHSHCILFITFLFHSSLWQERWREKIHHFPFSCLMLWNLEVTQTSLYATPKISKKNLNCEGVQTPEIRILHRNDKFKILKTLNKTFFKFIDCLQLISIKKRNPWSTVLFGWSRHIISMTYVYKQMVPNTDTSFYIYKNSDTDTGKKIRIR